MSQMINKVLIMAGGTGGHVIPALAVASELGKHNVKVSWMGCREGLESRLVVEAGLTFDAIDIKGLRKSGVLRKCLMPLILFKAICQAVGVFRKRKPDAVLGMGGFVSGPGALVSAILRTPIVLHEQNSVAGLTNRWLAKISQRVLTGFPVAEGINRAEWVGNPVRETITAIPPPGQRLKGRTGPLRILVIGGSQGASVFNQTLPRILSGYRAGELEVWHQCGMQASEDIDEINKQYHHLSIRSQVDVFINDMAEAYSWCDILIGRSGAMTVSEVCSAGVAAIFVPYPYAVNDHQAHNAAYLVDQGAAYMIRQTAFLKGEWLSTLEQVSRNRMQLTDMAVAARNLARPNASALLARSCMEVVDA